LKSATNVRLPKSQRSFAIAAWSRFGKIGTKLFKELKCSFAIIRIEREEFHS